MFWHILNGRIDFFSDNSDLLRPCFGAVSPANKPVHQLRCLNVYRDIAFLNLWMPKIYYALYYSIILVALLTCIFRKMYYNMLSFPISDTSFIFVCKICISAVVSMIYNRGQSCLLTWGC